MIEYTLPPAKHASDTVYWNTVNSVQKTDRLTYEGYAGAMASFVATGDPNKHKLTDGRVVGVPDIRKGRQFLVTKEGLGQGKIGRLEERCKFWLGVSARVPV